MVLGLVALTLAPSALALPEGFRVSARLTPRAQVISGGVGQVACPTNWTAWRALQSERGVPSAARGFTTHPEKSAYIDSDYCALLERWIRGRAPSDWERFGLAISVFIHESVHLRGLVDEGATDCTMLAEYRKWARALFGIKNTRRLSQLYGYALAGHRRGPAEYQSGC